MIVRKFDAYFFGGTRECPHMGHLFCYSKVSTVYLRVIWDAFPTATKITTFLPLLQDLSGEDYCFRSQCQPQWTCSHYSKSILYQNRPGSESSFSFSLFHSCMLESFCTYSCLHAPSLDSANFLSDALCYLPLLSPALNLNVLSLLLLTWPTELAFPVTAQPWQRCRSLKV